MEGWRCLWELSKATVLSHFFKLDMFVNEENEKIQRYSYRKFQMKELLTITKFPLVIHFTTLSFNAFVCNVKSTWPKPRACHFDSCKGHAEILPEEQPDCPDQGRPSERGVAKAQVSSLPLSSLPQHTERNELCVQKRNTFRVILESSYFICWSIPLWGKKRVSVISNCPW